jgi:hypothetical protein
VCCSSRTPSQAPDRLTKENEMNSWTFEACMSSGSQSQPLLRLPLVGLTFGNSELTGDAPRSGIIDFPVRERFFSLVSLWSWVRVWSLIVDTWKVVSFWISSFDVGDGRSLTVRDAFLVSRPRDWLLEGSRVIGFSRWVG